MATLQFRRFTNPQILRAIGRGLLTQFLDRFHADLSPACLPGAQAPDDHYYQALATALMSPERLPEGLSEALYAIDGMSSPDGLERLETAVAEAGMVLPLQPRSSRHEIALQVWLAAPELLARKHNEQRMRRLTRFEHFGTALPAPARAPFAAPEPVALQTLVESLDEWFARHQRGQQTTRIELYPLEGEYWFLIRHGDNFARVPSVNELRRTEIIHFRPERDDLAVYSPAHDEVRVHARTRGERELYRRQFGLWLRGAADYFSERSTYTLEPLRANGAEALNTSGLESISRITLRELEVVADNGEDQYTVLGARDVFGAAERSGEGFPTHGRLARAAFDVHFAGCRRARPVQIAPPNILKLGRHCDALAVDRWLCRSAFRLRAP